MSRISVSIFFIFIVLICFSNVFATSIIAPKTIKELYHYSDVVVYAKAVKVSANETKFEALQNLKTENSIESSFNVNHYSGFKDGIYYEVYGDAVFKTNQNYLLFLSKNKQAILRLSLLSFSCFEEKIYNGEVVFSQVSEAAHLHGHNGETHLLGLYKKDNLLNNLSKINSSNNTLGQVINIDLSNALINTVDVELLQSMCGDPQPSHCTYLFNNLMPGRFETMPLNVVVSNNDGTFIANDDPEYPGSGELTALNSACSILSLNYPNVTYSYNGLYTGFYPLANACSGGGAAQDDLQTHFAPDCNTLMVFFNDPCDQINDITPTGGILGIGGTFSFGSANTHTDVCGNSWANLCSPFLVINNGVYSNFGSAIYSKVIQHELTHCIGFGHIDGLYGSALMNDAINVNTQITNLDTDCVDFVYNPQIPVACEVPVNFVFTSNSLNSVTISWDLISNATNYQVNYREQFVGSFVPSFTNLNFKVLNNLDACKTYEFRVKAFCNDGSSSNFSNTSTFDTDCVDICQQLVNLQNVNPTNQSVLLSWDLVANTSYNLYYRKVGNTNWLNNVSAFPFALLFNLDECSDYEWYIELNCADGSTGDPSAVQIFSTTGNGC